jgi:hypothetical protein
MERKLHLNSSNPIYALNTIASEEMVNESGDTVLAIFDDLIASYQNFE